LQQIVDSSVHGDQPYVSALATLGTKELYIMLWNYHDDDSKRSTALINLALQNIPAAKAIVSSYLVDETHGNSYTLWKELGSPQEVSAVQFSQLEKAGKLQTIETGKPVKIAEGATNYQLSLAGQGVALLKFTW
jgi:xylan 1,4-beta-xylosidase